MPTSKPASPMLGSILCDDLRHFKVNTWWRMNREKVWILCACLLYLFALIQPSSEPTTEPLSYEEVGAIATNYASTLAACANGHSIWVGDILVWCERAAIVRGK